MPKRPGGCPAVKNPLRLPAPCRRQHPATSWSETDQGVTRADHPPAHTSLVQALVGIARLGGYGSVVRKTAAAGSIAGLSLWDGRTQDPGEVAVSGIDDGLYAIAAGGVTHGEHRKRSRRDEH